MSHVFGRDADQMRTKPADTTAGKQRDPREIVASQGFFSEPGIGFEPMTFSLQDRSCDSAPCGLWPRKPDTPTVSTLHHLVLFRPVSYRLADQMRTGQPPHDARYVP